MVQDTIKRGGSPEAIQHHYDVSNRFYALWLDQSLSYSCAFWKDEPMDDDLEQAQYRKIDWHLAASGATKGQKLLDIGCGWGALMNRYVSLDKERSATGLTLSHNQYQHIYGLNIPKIEVYEQSWIDHQPQSHYDAIVSIGAFEHFAQPGASRSEKVSVYRDFFSRCQNWLKAKGKLSLQTIAYGSLRAENKNLFIQNDIFPDSELPRLSEIFEAADGLFEVTIYRNDRIQYGKTCDLWLKNLCRQKQVITEEFGEHLYSRYQRYLKLSVAGFYLGQILLLRLEMQSLAN